MKAHNVSAAEIMMAVQNSNLDIGAGTIEINKAEYLVRGLGYIKSVADIEEAVVMVDMGSCQDKRCRTGQSGPEPEEAALTRKVSKLSEGL